VVRNRSTPVNDTLLLCPKSSRADSTECMKGSQKQIEVTILP
jgi:hypothetical protein